MRNRQDTGQFHIVRFILSGCVVRCAIVFALALVWNRFINRNGFLSLSEHTFFTAGVIFLAAAWFRYLKLDRVCIHHLLEKKKKSPRYKAADLTDYIETEPDSLDIRDEKQKTICHLISDLLTGTGLILISIVASFV